MVNTLTQFNSHFKVYEDCVTSKQHRDSFPKGKSWKAMKQLKIVHSDLCGPINPIFNGGKHHSITFIGDFSRKAWVYFLQEKNEAFNAFKHFKAFVEKEVEGSIKIFCTDHGGEYNSQ